MLQPLSLAQRGQVHLLPFESTILKGNAPKDPTLRQVGIYTPPGYEQGKSYPLFMDLAGYTGSGLGHLNWKAFGLNLPQRLDYLINAGKMGPVVAVFPDCFTYYGGNQYINSSATGRYMDYLIDEIIPFVEQRFSAGGSPSKRAVFGKSSGGYGAIVHALTRTDIWGAAACHSGDMYFEYAYLSDFADCLAALQKYDGNLRKFFNDLANREKLKHEETMALMTLGMAAHYDPDPAAELGFHLPFDLHTGAINWDRWKKWLEHDPVRMVETKGSNLKNLRGLFIDCGTKDQFHLLWGARMFHQQLVKQGIVHEYQEFDDNHSDIDYRMNESLPFLYGAVH